MLRFPLHENFSLRGGFLPALDGRALLYTMCVQQIVSFGRIVICDKCDIGVFGYWMIRRREEIFNNFLENFATSDSIIGSSNLNS